MLWIHINPQIDCKIIKIILYTKNNGNWNKFFEIRPYQKRKEKKRIKSFFTQFEYTNTIKRIQSIEYIARSADNLTFQRDFRFQPASFRHSSPMSVAASRFWDADWPTCLQHEYLNSNETQWPMPFLWCFPGIKPV